MGLPLRNYCLHAETGRFSITAPPVGFVVEGDPGNPAGRRVESRPAEGGRAESWIDQAGAFVAELSGPLHKGRANQNRALGVLIEALCARGSVAESIDEVKPDDHRGEDGLINLDGQRVVVQIVSVPVDQSPWRELASAGGARKSGTFEDAVEMVRQALVHKKGRAIDAILVLDASHFGAIIWPALVDAYHRKYGDPEAEFSLREAWLVGPTVRSTFRLGTTK